ncbi:hypothetical protein JOQ06_017106, partial [Pogonophryne albipinna]
MRYFLLRPETLFLLCISLALWSYFFHTDEVKTIVKSSRDAVKMVKGKVAEMMQNERFGGLDVLDAEFSKTWEFKSSNVAVYSIQGRRDHMEDRFEVLSDIVNKSHPSIFGIFDGHGGEGLAENEWATYMPSLRLCQPAAPPHYSLSPDPTVSTLALAATLSPCSVCPLGEQWCFKAGNSEQAKVDWFCSMRHLLWKVGWRAVACWLCHWACNPPPLPCRHNNTLVDLESLDAGHLRCKIFFIGNGMSQEPAVCCPRGQ